ncbi:MAG TPA: hypothetical protein PK528_15635 [Syntrophorhabdus sp.]|nr:hypothetical protein [Syntrophorhabdus sp.]
MKGTFSQRVLISTRCEQQIPFAESCLPKTIRLAKRNKARILPLLDKATEGFPFEDRVLIWLHSIWQEDVEKYHRSIGKAMTEMFFDSQHKLCKFDQYYREKLKTRLKNDNG